MGSFVSQTISMCREKQYISMKRSSLQKSQEIYSKNVFIGALTIKHFYGFNFCHIVKGQKIVCHCQSLPCWYITCKHSLPQWSSLCSHSWLPALHSNIRLRLKRPRVANTLAYYNTAKDTAVKRLIVHDVVVLEASVATKPVLADLCTT